MEDIIYKTPKWYKFILRDKWKYEIYNKFKNKKVLDIGCGYGKLLNKYPQWRGIDLIRKTNNKNFEKGSILKIPFKDKSFDLITCNHVLEHITKKDFFKATTEINRVINDKGSIFITGPNPMNPFYWDVFSHIHPVTLRQLIARFELLDFEVIEKGFTLFRRLPYNLQYILFLLIPHIPSEYYVYLKRSNGR